jgi:polyferredoxin/Flp pilus assembly protein TadD
VSAQRPAGARKKRHLPLAPSIPARQVERPRLYRALSFVAVHVLIGIHIAHWRWSGRTLAPLEPSEALHTLHRGIVTAGCVFFVVLILGTLLAGRFFCGWLCHVMALQELCATALARLGIQARPVRSRVLAWVPFLGMALLFVWPLLERALRSEVAPDLVVMAASEQWGSFTTHDYWRSFPGPLIAVLTFLVCGGLIVRVLGSRSFCRYACPYGAVFAAADRFAAGRIVLSGDCTGCGKCSVGCGSGVDVAREVREHGMVLDTRCMKSLDCVAGCPSAALSFRFTSPPSLRKVWRASWRRERTDFSWSEELQLGLTFVVALWALRDLYDAVPFLLALAAAALVAYASVIGRRLVWRRALPGLMREGRWTRRGQLTAALIAAALAFTAHAAWLSLNVQHGRRAYARLAAAGLELDLTQPVSPARRALAQAASAPLGRAYRARLFPWLALRRELTLSQLAAGEHAAAEPLLRAALVEQPEDASARLQLASVLLQRREWDAGSALLRPLWARSDVWAARAEATEAHALVRQGRGAEAIIHYRRALVHAADNPRYWLALGTLLARQGDLAAAALALRRSVALFPSSKLARENLRLVEQAQSSANAAHGADSRTGAPPAMIR